VVALLICTGCATIPFRQTPEDHGITQDVRAALAADKTPTLNQVTATSYGGYVILTGWANAAAAERARQIAHSRPGVRDVVDQIAAPERVGGAM
jgi:osmotically-inducible protein OsmY